MGFESNKVGSSGQIQETTLANLGSAQSAGNGAEMVVIDANNAAIDSNGVYWSRKSKPAKHHLFTGRNFIPDTNLAVNNLTRAYVVYKPILTDRKICKIKLVYSNWYLGTSGTETNNTSTPTLQCGVHKEGEILVTPVFFNGSRSRLFEAGETVVSDEIPFGIDPSVDAGFYIRQHVTMNATTDTLCTSSDMTTADSTNAKTYRITGATSSFVDNTTYSAGTREYGQYEFGPSAVLGVAEDGSVVPCVAIIGSSSAQGVGDTNNTNQNTDFCRGYLARSLKRAKIPYINTSISGETGTNFLGNGGAKRRMLLGMCNFTHAVSTYGSNDIGGAVITTDAGMQSLLQNLNKLMKGWGAIPHLCTFTPATSSTDAWATTANQTVLSPLRQSANTWLLSNSSTYNIIDLEKWSDSGRVLGQPSTGKWRVDLGKPTNDGLHGQPQIHNAIASGIILDNGWGRVKF